MKAFIQNTFSFSAAFLSLCRLCAVNSWPLREIPLEKPRLVPGFLKVLLEIDSQHRPPREKVVVFTFSSLRRS